uniref:Hypotheticial protein n=1 Tax=Schistosoma japonicum TaxID=6182 RepID=C1LES9_SCHJA|nr:hypotheticial protein [Schistosoma japonicum]
MSQYVEFTWFAWLLIGWVSLILLATLYCLVSFCIKSLQYVGNQAVNYVRNTKTKTT